MRFILFKSLVAEGGTCGVEGYSYMTGILFFQYFFEGCLLYTSQDSLFSNVHYSRSQLLEALTQTQDSLVYYRLLEMCIRDSNML